MTWKALATALFLFFNQTPKAREAARVAPIIYEEATRYDIKPETLAAVVAHESRFRKDARGGLGEIGLGQLKRGTLATAGYEHLSDEELARPRLNLRLAARHLAHAKKLCGGKPVRWLSRYNGRKCGPSSYSRKVVKIIEELRTTVKVEDVRVVIPRKI